jgi:hypothetical protein
VLNDAKEQKRSIRDHQKSSDSFHGASPLAAGKVYRQPWQLKLTGVLTSLRRLFAENQGQ